jgi:ubiquinone/menaquinone biosynthesis C-methylase UbiE
MRIKQIDSERVYHNKWAKNDFHDISNDFNHFLSLENRWIIQHLPEMHGKNVLDIGCGLGEASLYFAKCGAHVTSVDVSEGMIESCVAAAKREGFCVSGVVSSVECLKLTKRSFDIVYASNILHHLENPKALIKKISLLIKKNDGIAFFIDPLKYNPIINIYRRIASDVRTKDEKPVGFEVLGWMKESFKNVNFRCMWLLTQILFLKYFFIDRVTPNKDRYWKRILKEGKSTQRWINPIIKIDNKICQTFPLLNYMCWNIVIAAKSPKDN